MATRKTLKDYSTITGTSVDKSHYDNVAAKNTQSQFDSIQKGMRDAESRSYESAKNLHNSYFQGFNKVRQQNVENGLNSGAAAARENLISRGAQDGYAGILRDKNSILSQLQNDYTSAVRDRDLHSYDLYNDALRSARSWIEQDYQSQLDKEYSDNYMGGYNDRGYGAYGNYGGGGYDEGNGEVIRADEIDTMFQMFADGMPIYNETTGAYESLSNDLIFGQMKDAMQKGEMTQQQYNELMNLYKGNELMHKLGDKDSVVRDYYGQYYGVGQAPKEYVSGGVGSEPIPGGNNPEAEAIAQALSGARGGQRQDFSSHATDAKKLYGSPVEDNKELANMYEQMKFYNSDMYELYRNMQHKANPSSSARASQRKSEDSPYKGQYKRKGRVPVDRRQSKNFEGAKRTTSSGKKSQRKDVLRNTKKKAKSAGVKPDRRQNKYAPKDVKRATSSAKARQRQRA